MIYRNEYGDTTTDVAVTEGWSDAAMEVDCREGPDAPWRPFNYEGEEAVTADRIAYYAAREAALEGDAPTPEDEAARVAEFEAARLNGVNPIVEVALTEYDRGRMESLQAYFKRINPDIEAPAPALILRMALDELHRSRVGQAPGGKYWVPGG